MRRVLIIKKIWLVIMWVCSSAMIFSWFADLQSLKPATIQNSYLLDSGRNLENSSLPHADLLPELISEIERAPFYHVTFTLDRGTVPLQFYFAGFYPEFFLTDLISRYGSILEVTRMTLVDRPFFFTTILLIACALIFNFAFLWLLVVMK